MSLWNDFISLIYNSVTSNVLKWHEERANPGEVHAKKQSCKPNMLLVLIYATWHC